MPGTRWEITYTGNSGFVNNVDAELHRDRAQDQWNPTDKMNVDLGCATKLRVQSRQYVQQRSKLLVLGRAERILLQPDHA